MDEHARGWNPLGITDATGTAVVDVSDRWLTIPNRVRVIYSGDIRSVSWDGREVSLMEPLPLGLPLSPVLDALAEARDRADAAAALAASPEDSVEQRALASFLARDAGEAAPAGALTVADEASEHGALSVADPPARRGGLGVAE